MKHFRIIMALIMLVSALALQALPTQAYPVGAYSKIFEGIEYNTGYTTSPRTMRAWALRISLRNPEISLGVSPGNGGAPYDTALQTTPAFLSTYGLKCAINASFFDAGLSPNTDIWGLLISGGSVVSGPYSAPFDSQLNFTADKAVSMIQSGSIPPGIYSAISGAELILYNGQCISGNTEVNPRTFVGISQDQKYIILVCVDGRQPGWSDGCNHPEAAQWLLDFGAWHGLLMDGGGSTCMSISGMGSYVNRPCYGYARSVGANFGVYSVPSNTEGVSGCSMNSNRYDIVYRGNMNSIVWRTWTNTGGWGAPVNLGGTTYSEPAIVSRVNNSFEVFHRGTNNHLYVGSWLNGVWYTWTDLGGNITSAPCAIHRDANTMDVYARGASNQLMTIGWINGTGWGGWQDLGGTLTSSPTAISRSSNTVDVYARGTSNQLITRGWLNGVWYPWASLDGSLASSPSACNRDANHIEVFAVDTSGHLRVKSWLSGTWYGWEDLGAQPATRPAAFCPTSTSIVTVHRGSNDHQFQHTWSGSWGGYVDIGCPF